MALTAQLQVMKKHAFVRSLTFNRDPAKDSIGEPWVSLTISLGSPGNAELVLLTTEPALLDRIASECTDLAGWLRSEADTKLLPDAASTGP